jgi:DeoR family ulaG and ulaABCDEF operon transcriptional repressor
MRRSFWVHATEREAQIYELISASGFVSFVELEKRLDASPATIRRDLGRMAKNGRITRVRGGARLPQKPQAGAVDQHSLHLSGIPFHENVNRNRSQKEAIGRAAAALCQPGEGVMVDGGSTTLQMCPHLAELNLQILTNSLHIVSALLPQPGTRILVPSGTLFREQNIILSAAGEDSMPSFHAPKLFMGAGAIGPRGLMQPDVVLVASERRLIDAAEELIVLVDSSKFENPSGFVVCPLDLIDTLITDSGIKPVQARMIEDAGIKLIIAPER